MRSSTAIAFMLPLSALCAPFSVDDTISQFRGRVQNALAALESLKNLASSVAGGPEIDYVIGGAESIGFILGGTEAAQISVRQTSDIVEQGFSAENVPHMSQEAYVDTYSSLVGIPNTLFVHSLRRSVETIFDGRCPMYKFDDNLPRYSFATPGTEDWKALINGIGAALNTVDYVVYALWKISSLDGMSLESLFEAAGGRIPSAAECYFR